MQSKNILSTALFLSMFLYSCNSDGQKQSENSKDIVKAMQVKTGIGAPYGARDPQSCGNFKNPVKGVPNATQAKEYFTCYAEYASGDNLYLVSDVVLEVGKPRPYNANEDYNSPNIDVTSPVLPVHGSYKEYQCSKVSDYMQNRGKNCNVYLVSNAVGLCYKNSFGDWVCKMGSSDNKLISQNGPSPQ